MNQRWIGTTLCVAASLAACAGGQQQPRTSEEPPPLFESEEDSGGVAPTSSAKVQAGVDAIQSGRFDAAKDSLEAAVSESPNDAQAHFYLGVALQALGEATEAIGHYERALELEPGLGEARVNLTAALLDAGEADRALTVLDDALAADPKNGALLLNRGLALSQKGDATGAASAFEQALAARPEDDEVRFLYAEALAEKGDRDGAVRELSRLGKSSGDLAVLASSGRLLGRLKAFSPCIDALDRAIAKQPDAELFVQRGLCKHGAKDDEGAGADYEASVAKDPSYAAGYFYLGQHRRVRGDRKGARTALDKAVALDPEGGVGKAAQKALQGL
jgi:uncharacterized protein (TIGR02996 family)